MPTNPSIHFTSRQLAHRIDGGVAVVVDVMRAYTTAAWAFHGGAQRIVLTDDVEDAVAIAGRIGGPVLLFKDGVPDKRFDLHNSPHQLRSLDVEGRVIVQRTTAGTVGAMAARGADQIFCTGYVTASATAAAVREVGSSEVTFVVTGGEGRAEEDLSCAEFMAALVAGERPDASPFVARAEQSEAAVRLRDALAAGYTGTSAEDVPMCLEVDRFDFAMVASPEPDGLTLHPSRRFSA